MKENRRGRLKRLILPGLIFQSVVISGGYGTGAELTEHVFPYGVKGGLLAIGVSTFLIWTLVCAISFEFARVFKTFDYRSFFQKLLGRGWVLYEGCYLVMLLLVLAVISATAGESAIVLFGASRWWGVAVMGGCIAALVLKGTAAVERFLSYWSYVLYAVYTLFLVMCFRAFHGAIAAQFDPMVQIQSGWALGGAKYAFYNLGIIPAVLFATRGAKSRKEAVLSGSLAAAIGVAPAIFLLVAMAGFYPDIMDAAVPINTVFQALHMPWLEYLFQLVLFGTLVETGTGYIKALSDRIESTKGGGAIARRRVMLTGGCILTGVLVSGFGLTSLIRQGYGTITWGFLLIYVLPITTAGVYKIIREKRAIRVYMPPK
ncbi:MAG: hypothetical protein LBS18_02890 [Clostridiales bacterium]|nr:hypothetical protein [Clostridiales bacterium]